MRCAVLEKLIRAEVTLCPEADIDTIERQRDDGRAIAAVRKSEVTATVRAAESRP